MDLVVLANDRLRLEVSPDIGGSIASLAAWIDGSWLPVLRPTPADALSRGRSSPFASYALVPWSNRVRDARFRFDGRDVQLRPNTAERHAIHGEVRDHPWRIESREAHGLSLSFDSRDRKDIGFPFPFTSTLSFSVNGPTASMGVSVTNAGNAPMPAGVGFHPYFLRALRVPGEEPLVRMNAPEVYGELLPRDAAAPVGPDLDFRLDRPLGGRPIDHCFAGWDGRAEIRWPASGVRAALEASEPFRHVVLYSPPAEPFFALEPVSHANDGFNLLASGIPGSGVRVLEPGETLDGIVRLTVT